MKKSLSFTLNGAPTTLEVDQDRLLLWVLRTELDLTGTKYGCGSGYCGSCTVMVDGEVVGGIGLSSGTPQQDMDCAQAGIDHFLSQRS